MISREITGREDQTPEETSRFQDNSWPIMGDSFIASPGRTVFSIEELTTVDTDDLPSVDD
ncbi:hypothetical protein GCM10009067_39820 [Haloarcula sebkhae]|uniref:Uncharacterized protein n=1 Tax=Haloarcula sebkhae TaxID=932660 RepID=A0A830EX56_9EURY|nr:hypothetical protein GCM10009067_39820 [Haloarcula sebkhae]